MNNTGNSPAEHVWLPDDGLLDLNHRAGSVRKIGWKLLEVLDTVVFHIYLRPIDILYKTPLFAAFVRRIWQSAGSRKMWLLAICDRDYWIQGFLNVSSFTQGLPDFETGSVKSTQELVSLTYPGVSLTSNIQPSFFLKRINRGSAHPRDVDSGSWQVRVVQIGAMPPLDVQKATRQDAKVTDWRTSWSDFDWEVDGSHGSMGWRFSANVRAMLDSTCGYIHA